MSNHNSREMEILSREKFDKVYPPENFRSNPNISFASKSVEIEKKRIQEYESLLHNLKMTYLEDDHAWKNIVEDLVKMLAEDRVEVLKNKKDLLGK